MTPPRVALLVAALLLGISVAAWTTPSPPGPLSAAAAAGNVATLEVLLQTGMDPNTPDGSRQNHWVPLMHAVHKHRVAAVELLLDKGAWPDGPATGSLTPLMMAVASGQADVARLLLSRGADVRRRLPDGSTILALAVSGGGLTDIDEPLLGRCHLDTVQIVRAAAPDLALGRSLRAGLARLFADLNGCHQALALADAPAAQ